MSRVSSLVGQTFSFRGACYRYFVHNIRQRNSQVCASLQMSKDLWSRFIGSYWPKTGRPSDRNLLIASTGGGWYRLEVLEDKAYHSLTLFLKYLNLFFNNRMGLLPEHAGAPRASHYTVSVPVKGPKKASTGALQFLASKLNSRYHRHA